MTLGFVYFRVKHQWSNIYLLTKLIFHPFTSHFLSSIENPLISCTKKIFERDKDPGALFKENSCREEVVDHAKNRIHSSRATSSNFYLPLLCVIRLLILSK